MEQVAIAFSPAHVTGLFQIYDRPEDPLLKGSRGAGFSLAKGVKTTIHVKNSARKYIKVNINGEIAESADVSISVCNAFLSLVESSYQILVEHEIEVPIGCGFGSSGAGALSLALALNEALSLKLSRVEAAQIAHVAEVKCKTGLGTVVAEMFGGVEIRVKPGAPNVGEIESISTSDDYVAACLCFGPISTVKVLTNRRLRRIINKLGGSLTDDLARNPKLSNFMEFSRRFAESTGLISERLRKVFVDTDDHGITCSMAMIGETAFSIVKRDEVEELLKIFLKHTKRKQDLITAKIDLQGARVLQ